MFGGVFSRFFCNSVWVPTADRGMFSVVSFLARSSSVTGSVQEGIYRESWGQRTVVGGEPPPLFFFFRVRLVASHAAVAPSDQLSRK